MWASYSVGLVANQEILISSIKQLVLRTLIENGMAIDRDVKINISFIRRDSESIAAVISVTKALVISSLTSALEQAIGKKVSLPISAQEILHLKEEKKKG